MIQFLARSAIDFHFMSIFLRGFCSIFCILALILRSWTVWYFRDRSSDLVDEVGSALSEDCIMR